MGIGGNDANIVGTSCCRNHRMRRRCRRHHQTRASACGPLLRLSRRGILMPRSRREFLTRARLLAAGASLSTPALAHPLPKVRWTMTSTFQPSLDRLWLTRRGLVVAVAGIVFCLTSQASLVEGSRGRLRSEFCADHAAVTGAHRISTRKSSELGECCAGADTCPSGPSAIAPKSRVEIARN